MERRVFLRLLGLGAAVAVSPELDLDRLLWTPGAKRIFLPSPPKLQAFKVTGVYAAHHSDYWVDKILLQAGIASPGVPPSYWIERQAQALADRIDRNAAESYLKVGDTFTIAGHYAINPKGRRG